MTDTPETPETPGTPETLRPAPRPGAAAASRARRIGGGRPAPRPAVVDEAPAGDEPAEPPALDEPGGATEPTDSAAVTGSADLDAGGVDLAKPSRPPRSGKPLPIEDGAPPAVPPWLNWAPAGVLVAGCVVMAVLIAIFSHGVWWGPDRAAPPSRSTVAQQREQVLAAAKSCVVAANDYDYRTLAAYEKRALACTTGGLTSQLKRTIESLIMKNAPTLKAKQATRITRGGIETVTPDGKQWTLLLFGQLSVVNAKDTSGRVDPFAAQVRVEKAHGKWLLAKLTVVSLPVSSG